MAFFSEIYQIWWLTLEIPDQGHGQVETEGHI